MTGGPGRSRIRAVVILAAAAVLTALVLPPPRAEAQAPQEEADALLDGIQALLSEGRNAEARTALQEAHRTFQRQGDRPAEAACLLFLSMLNAAAADSGGAADALERSTAMLEAQGNRFDSWLALSMRGIFEGAMGRPLQALALHRRSLALLREIEASTEPLSLRAFEVMLRFFGLPTEDLRRLQANPELGRPVMLRVAETLSRNGYVEALVDAGRLEEAEAELPRLAELSRDSNGWNDAKLAVLLGDLRRRQWRLDEAKESYLQALARLGGLATPLRDPQLELKVLEYLAELASWSSRTAEALIWSDKALALARAHGQPDDELGVLRQRALILRTAQRIDDAELTLAAALALARQRRDIHRQALIEGDLAQLAIDRSQYEKAASYLETAIGRFQALDVPGQEAEAWTVLSLIYTRLATPETADATLERAEALARRSRSPVAKAQIELVAAVLRFRFDRGPASEVEASLAKLLELPGTWDWQEGRKLQRILWVLMDAEPGAPPRTAGPPGVSAFPEVKIPTTATISAMTRFVLGVTLYQRGEFAAAREVWLAALAASPPAEVEVFLLAATAGIALLEGQVDEAVRYYTRAVEAIEKVADDARVDEFLASYLGSDVQQIFHVLVEILVTRNQPEEAFAYAERARARMILQQLGNPRLRPERDADPRLVSEAEALHVGIADLERQAAFASAAERERLSSDLRHARQRYQSLLVRLKISSGRYDTRLRVEPLSAARVRAELPPDTTLVSYFVSSAGRVHAWVLDREALHYLPLPVGPEQLRRAVCWAEEVGRGTGDDRSALRLDPRCQGESASAEDLYERLIAALPGTVLHSRIILIPHGDLHYIPFAALRNPRTGRYLIEDHTLIYAPSASALRHLRTLETPVAGRALVLGDPASEAAGLPELRAAKKEATVVAHLFGTEPMLGSQAKECLLHELGDQVDLLHIAAHGIYEPKDPLFSRIGLAPSQGYDGNLEVHEILSGLDLSGVNLVVLAACSTAAGERSGGDDVVGLTRAFLYAGSPGVISALWKINDNASALLMEKLYSGLLAGRSAAEALRQAQLSMLRTQSYSAPYFWAAFTLTGDPQGRWQNSALR